MRMTYRRACRTWAALTVLIAVALVSTAASASSFTTSRPSLTATAAAFDLNGLYTDGGSARPGITDVNDILTINMSSQNRPNASGVVINSDTIVVTFPDDRTYGAKLTPPGTIRWSNNAIWTKVALVVVPGVVGLDVRTATTTLQSAGLVVPTPTLVPGCPAGEVQTQNPAAGTQVPRGTAVRLSVAKGAPICP